MKRLNNLFVILFILIGLLSVAYIWKSETDKKVLETAIDLKSREINILQEEVSQLNLKLNSKTDNYDGNVKGTSKIATGTISGKVQFSNPNVVKATIVCAQDKFTIKEFCTDELMETANTKIFTYFLEIPKGQYLIYAVTPPDDNKIYYSEVQKCTNDDSCENDRKILLEIIEDEIQKDINLYL